MISLFRACCSTLLFSTHIFEATSESCKCFLPFRKPSFWHSGARTVNSKLLLTRIHIRCYSSKKSGGGGGSGSLKKKLPKKLMKDDREAFFVVRKGDLVGVYKSLSDCQAQVGTSVCDPPVSVYKGHSMPKDTEKYLISCGLKNALYTIRASDLTEQLFGTLVSCPFPEAVGPMLASNDGLTKHLKLDSHKVERNQSACRSCTLEFDGSSKGNPGQAGAGAVLRSDDGSLICRLREGLGVATNNAAEYRAFILGLKYALGKGFTSVRVRGDSKLVCMQIQGLWKVKNQNIFSLYDEAKKLKDKFHSFQIIHVLRDLNSEADAQANLAVDLAEGQVQEEIDK
ncbi:uncharacterized protein LOC127245281 isoform X2 [Andrographis paniculata]|uniref:uncharacterized protein LOC127245281 isoform X2 n=1 Tax=Andrographis paniculata TaxID=175694 RepID=UPI0021E72EB0|nr:uncharacterized protein LOC127245281 isoform X2 [Andrographis paniculata]